MLFSAVGPEKTEEFIDRLLEKSKIGTWEYYPETNEIILKGEVFLAMVLGRNMQTFAMDFTEFLEKHCYAGDLNKIHYSYENALANNEQFEFDFRILRHEENSSGEVRWLHIFGWPVEDEKTGALYLVGGMQDAHEKMTYQMSLQKIRDAEDRAQILIDATPLCCNFWDENLNNIDCNEEALKLFGFSDRDGYLENFMNLWPQYQPDGSLSIDAFVAKLKTTFAEGYQRFEWMQQAMDGTPIPCEVTLVRVKYGNSFIVAAYSRDLREIKATLAEIEQAKQELRIARDLAELNAKAKSEFLANMSHEIRTPMNAILGMLHLLSQTPIEAKQQYYLDKANVSARSLLRIINDILDFSKIEAGKLEIEKIEFTLESVMKNISDLVLDQVLAKKLDFTFQVAPDVPFFLMGDSLRLGQILINIIGNAVKFTSQGGIQIGVTAEEVTDSYARLRFSVADTGIGMSPEQTKALFAPFSQADTSTTRKFGGTGLGLAISKSLVNLMGGEIWCESELNKGTTFFFEASFLLDGKNKQPVQNLSNVKVMLLGDNIEDLASLRFKLQILRSQVQFMYVDAKAKEFAFAQTDFAGIDVIIMDFMEDKNAFVGAMQKLEELDLSLPVLFSLLSQQERPQISPKWDVGFVYKPTTLSYLYNCLMGASGSSDRREVYSSADEVKEITIPEEIYGAKILLAEDNEINQLLAVELLSQKGFVVEVANTGRQAVQMLERQPYDLILMDIQMPEMDGLTATKIIRKDSRWQNLPILAMTANAMSGDKEVSLEAGMDDHIAKPIEPVVLYKTLIYWLCRQKQISVMEKA